MSPAVKIVVKNFTGNKKRTLLTFFGVVLPVLFISFVCALLPQFISAAELVSDAEDMGHVMNFCVTFAAVTAVMSGFMIYTVFAINFDGRTKMMGLLSSLGMSGLQKGSMVLAEALIYAFAAVPAGVAGGTLAARVFYRQIGKIVSLDAAVFSFDFGWIAFAAVLGVLATLAASFVPMLRLKRISVMDAVRVKNKINISLRQSFLSSLAEKRFGRLGKLAGQAYDNHKGIYRGIALSLSGGTIFYTFIYSFFMYAFQDDRISGRELEPDLVAAFRLCMLFGILVIFIFLTSSAGSAFLNIERRKREFAILKSLGMDNSDLRRMMIIETVFLVFYAAVYGLLGSVVLNAVFFVFITMVGATLFFSYPVWIFIVFVAFDAAVGLVFALYSVSKVKKVKIIEAIKGE